MKRILKKLIADDRVWALLNSTDFEVPTRLKQARNSALLRRIQSRLPPPSKVASGPFRGLVYPTHTAVGSALLPKLLGTYESELHEEMARLLDRPLERIIDIGCAEGYYAVGFARHFPEAVVVAYDISAEAREACRLMARANNATRLEIRESCSRDQLLSLDPLPMTLVISDCEGFEKHLFDTEVTNHLRSASFVIELHDYTDRGLDARMEALFRQTHEVRMIRSLDDLVKVASYQSEFVSSSDFLERSVAFWEGRGELMQWLIAHPLGEGLLSSVSTAK